MIDLQVREDAMEIRTVKRNEGIRRLVEKGWEAFNISENINYYSEEDFRAAQKKFIKLCVLQQRCS